MTPLRVDWLPGVAVGLTIAPGRRVLGQPPRDLDADLQRLRHVERVDVLVCLLERNEMRALGVHDLATRARALGMRVLRLALRDGEVPGSHAHLAELLNRIGRHVDAGRRVVVHCRGGLGRSGVVAGCLLRERGVGAARALGMLRAARGPGCPETPAQVAFVRGWRATR